tara:strand:- start:382 stop:687 length:306 start_codon:yes stop_codon:yes gene_type:complete
MTDEKKFDSVLVGYTEEPRYYDGQFGSVTVKYKVTELQEMIDKYATPVQENGDGGNVFCKTAISKNGKPYTTVFDPNSEAAKENKAARTAKLEAVSNDMPF